MLPKSSDSQHPGISNVTTAPPRLTSERRSCWPPSWQGAHAHTCPCAPTPGPRGWGSQAVSWRLTAPSPQRRLPGGLRAAVPVHLPVLLQPARLPALPAGPHQQHLVQVNADPDEDEARARAPGKAQARAEKGSGAQMGRGKGAGVSGGAGGWGGGGGGRGLGHVGRW